jgi:hypothetical protein
MRGSHGQEKSWEINFRLSEIERLTKPARGTQ